MIAVVGAIALVPVAAWASAAAEPDEVADECSTTTTTTTVVAVADPCTVGNGATPPAATTTTTTTPAESTAPPTTVEATTTTTFDPSAPTTTVDPNVTATTVDPNVTTTTLDPNATTTTLDPATTAPAAPTDSAPPTTDAPVAPVAVPDPEGDIVEGPIDPAVEVPSGRIAVPAGSIDTGALRPITFPVAGPVSYVNDFGACRDGCARAHKGNDLIGDRLQPLLAMADGVVHHLIEHPTAGYGVAIVGNDGWRYDIYHMNNDNPGTDDGVEGGTWRFLPGVVAGARVTAGQQLGWMGDSGNSEHSVPHVHVEIHTPEGLAVNPYWSLRAAQRAVNCAVGDLGEPVPAPMVTAPAPAVAAIAGAPTTTTTTTTTAPATGTETTTTTVALGETTRANVGPAADWLTTGWPLAALPDGWMPFTVTGGRPGSGAVAARFWISPIGFTPVDGAAVKVGDPRYDAGVDCAQPDALAPSSNVPAELGAILATIRAIETGGNYNTSITSSSASGAYAFLDSSWGGYGGYLRAKDAPPAVQDAKAVELATYILQRNGGDVSTIPVSWYIGHVPVGGEWDTVPVPEAGNRLTPRQYQDRWMTRYAAVAR